MLEFIYVYHTGDRPDGYAYAVGEGRSHGKTDGSVALFKSKADAIMFATHKSVTLGVELSVMPSAEKGE